MDSQYVSLCSLDRLESGRYGHYTRTIWHIKIQVSEVPKSKPDGTLFDHFHWESYKYLSPFF